MGNNIRNCNIELLRILCMCFIIAGHVIMKYPADDIGTVEYYISNILRSFFMVSVNCFIIISGYFGIRLNIKKLLKMSMQVSFYVISIYIILVCFRIHNIEIKKDILLLFPILTKQYWYITIYFVLCLISPILNIVVNNISKKQFKTMLIIITLIFYVLPTFLYPINAPTITGDSGYGIINFICLYFIGRYIKLYYNEQKNSAYYAVGYVISSLLLFLSNHILTVIFGFYFNSFISYDTIFLLISAFMLFMTFNKMSIKSNIISNLSKYCLAAYVIHMHPRFTSYLFDNIFNISTYSGVGYILIIFIIPIIVYTVSWIIEFIRVKLFSNLEDKIIEKIINVRVSKNMINVLLNEA